MLGPSQKEDFMPSGNLYKYLCPSIASFELMCLAALCCAVMTSVHAQQPGDLDPRFGSGGKVITSLGQGDDFARSVAIQSDGKIVAAGFSHIELGVSDTALTRYNADGSLDTMFGSGGKVSTAIGAGDDGAFSVAIQPDGKIVAAGISCYDVTLCQDGGGQGFTLTRYNADGSLDAGFGSGGIVVTPIGWASSVAIQTDGKIVAAGSNQTDFVLARYNADGSLDTGFGSGGIVTTNMGGVYGDFAYSLAIQSDGKIVAAGGSFNGNYDDDWVLARYYADGSLDTGFGSGGIVVTDMGIAYSVAIRSDGKILAAGFSCSDVVACQGGGGIDFALARYNADGSLDSGFGSGGRVVTRIVGRSFAYSLAIQSDEKIVAAGESYEAPPPNHDFALVRYNTDGSRDRTFGGDGIVTTDFGGDSNDSALGIALDCQGRAVVVGGSDGQFAIARFLMASPHASYDFDGDGRSDISVFRPSDAVWYLDQSTQGFSATQFGVSTDKIVPADYDGDGRTDIGVYRPSTGTWYCLNSSTGTMSAVQFGASEDLLTPADYDGDGRADTSVFRPSDGVWYRLNSSTGSFAAVQFGLSGDKPTLGDFEGDGRADIAVFRPSNSVWYRLDSSNGSFSATQFGVSTDLITPADFDGDGRTDIAVFSPSEGNWYVNESTGGFMALRFGISTDIPAAADFDGDGHADFAVFRPSDGNWYQLNSSNGNFMAQHFGLAGDRPLPSAFAF